MLIFYHKPEMIIFKEEKSVAFCAGCNQEELLDIYNRVRRREGSNTTIMIVLSGMNIMIKMTVCIDLIQNRIEYTDICFNHPHCTSCMSAVITIFI